MPHSDVNQAQRVMCEPAAHNPRHQGMPVLPMPLNQCSRTPAAPIAIPARFSGDSEKATVKETVAFHRFPSRLERTEYKTPTVPGSVPHLLCPTRRALGRCKQPAWLHLVAKATV